MELNPNPLGNQTWSTGIPNVSFRDGKTVDNRYPKETKHYGTKTHKKPQQSHLNHEFNAYCCQKWTFWNSNPYPMDHNSKPFETETWFTENPNLNHRIRKTLENQNPGEPNPYGTQTLEKP